jgi:branched-chain amino acid transport system ATP-binding protein
MLTLCRVLIPKPKLLMLDEPSLVLSPNLVSSVFKKIHEISKNTGIAVLIVEQKVRDVLKICQRVYGLRLGKVEFAGNPEEKMHDDQLRWVFL